MPRDVEQLASDLRTVLEERGFLNLHAQAHARTLLNQLGTPVVQWPRFTPSLDERLLYGAHLMLVRGMEFSDDDTYADLSRDLLLRGAESLEFIAELPQTRLSQFDERLNAAIGYHVAGYHARSYVMVSRLDQMERARVASDSIAPAILALLRRDLRTLSATCLQLLDNEAFQDAPLAAGLRVGEVEDDDAIAALGRRSLTEALLRYLEYAKRGTPDLLQSARDQCQRVALLGQQAGHVDLWWLALAIEKLLRDLGDSSLWGGLRDLAPQSPYGEAIERYIEAAFTIHSRRYLYRTFRWTGAYPLYWRHCARTISWTQPEPSPGSTASVRTNWPSSVCTPMTLMLSVGSDGVSPTLIGSTLMTAP